MSGSVLQDGEAKREGDKITYATGVGCAKEKRAKKTLSFRSRQTVIIAAINKGRMSFGERASLPQFLSMF